jgi:integrase
VVRSQPAQSSTTAEAEPPRAARSKKKARARRGSAAVYNRGTKEKPNWWIRFTHEGRQIREPATGAKLKSQAEALLSKRKHEVFEGTFFPAKKHGRITMKALAELWEKAKAHKASLASDKVRFKLLVELLGGDVPITLLTPERIRDLIAELREKETRFGETMKPASINRHLELLRAALRLPEAKACLHGDPMDGVDFVEVNNERDRICSPDEYEQLIAAATPNLKLAIEIAYATGMRDGEVCSLRWSRPPESDGKSGWVDLKAKMAYLPSGATKTREARKVPLTPKLKKTIDASPRHISGRIVPIKASTVSSLFTRLCKDVGIVDLHFHDLRHTALTRLRRAGVDVFTIAAISGHRDLASLRRYQTHSDEDLHAAISKTGR